MPTSISRIKAIRSRVSICALLGAFLPLMVAAGEQKKSAPAPAPAAHAAAPAGQHPAGAAPGGAPAPHGPTTGGGANAGHGVTTSNPGGGHVVTTNTASGGHVTTGSPGAAKPGGAAARPAAPTAGGHVVAAGGTSSFAGHPAPAGSHEMHAANGAAVRTRADGSHSDIHDPARGMDIHHGLNGNTRVSVERADHTRIVAERGGRGYVQHPYMFHGHEFGHRTYYEHGRAYDRFYGRYPYHGRYLDVYAPGYYYPYGFYGYAYAPWAAPVPYAWGWGAAPWYGYYGAYYAPYPVYPAPAFWLTDFVIAASLEAAYAARTADQNAVPNASPALLLASRWLTNLLLADTAEAAASSPPVLSPDVKAQVADEIKLLVQQEGTEAQANAAHQDVDPGTSSIAHLMSDNKPHVFVAGVDLDLVNGSGQECAISQGDVIRVMSPPAPSTDTAAATILASKGGKECVSAATVSVGISDLQDMQNHMRETIDDGLKDLQAKQGQSGLPAAPASASGPPVQAALAAGAPPPDSNAGSEINQQSQAATQAERDASASVASALAPNSGSSTTIALGQTIDQVTAALGNPTRIIDAGTKQIYAYPDMRIIFQNGKVSDVQ